MARWSFWVSFLAEVSVIVQAGKGDGGKYTAQRSWEPVRRWVGHGPPVLELPLHCEANGVISRLVWGCHGWERLGLAG